MEKIFSLAHTRIKTFGDFFDLCDFLFKNKINLSEELLVPKKSDSEIAKAILYTVITYLDEIQNWDKNSLEQATHFAANFLESESQKNYYANFIWRCYGKAFRASPFCLF